MQRFSRPSSKRALLTKQHAAQSPAGARVSRAFALLLVGLVVTAGCGGVTRFVPDNDNSGGSFGGSGDTDQNQNDNTPQPNDNDNADDIVEPGLPGGLEGLWFAEVDDPNSDLPAGVVIEFDEFDEVVGMSVQGTQVNEAIGYASTTRIDDTVQILWDTDGGFVVYDGILSGDGNRITGTLRAPLTFGSDETFTIQRGTLDLDRSEPDPAPDPEPDPEPDPDPDQEPDPDPDPEPDPDPDPDPEPDPDPDPDPGVQTLVELDPITFFGDVLAGVDPTTFPIGGGTVEFEGGIGATLGLEGLYFGFVDAFAWMPNPGTATITFVGLDVRRVDFYFADVGSPGAVLVVEGQDGETIETVPSHTAAARGDTLAQFSIGDANGPRISRLVIETPNGVTSSLDQLVIWALQ